MAPFTLVTLCPRQARPPMRLCVRGSAHATMMQAAGILSNFNIRYSVKAHGPEDHAGNCITRARSVHISGSPGHHLKECLSSLLEPKQTYGATKHLCTQSGRYSTPVSDGTPSPFPSKKEEFAFRKNFPSPASGDTNIVVTFTWT